MPRKAKAPPLPAADAAPAATIAEAPVASPVVAPNTIARPRIEYLGEGADKVIFTVNPKAALLRVYGNGTIVETL